MAKTIAKTARHKPEVLDLIEQQAKDKGIPAATLISKIIEAWTQAIRKAQQEGKQYG
jgi:hypothetical protein